MDVLGCHFWHSKSKQRQRRTTLVSNACCQSNVKGVQMFTVQTFSVKLSNKVQNAQYWNKIHRKWFKLNRVLHL